MLNLLSIAIFFLVFKKMCGVNKNFNLHLVYTKTKIPSKALTNFPTFANISAKGELSTSTLINKMSLLKNNYPSDVFK